MALIQFPGQLGDVREKTALASVCPSHWAAVLTSLERLFPGASAVLERVGTGAADSGQLTAAGNSGLRRIIGARWDAQGLDFLSVGTIFRMRELPEAGLPSSRRREAESADDGAGGGAGIVLDRRDSRLWVLSVQVPLPLGERYDAAIATLLRRLAPDLRRSFLVSHRLGTTEQPDRATIESSWDELSVGVVLLSAGLRPLAVNMAAEEIVTTRRFFAPLGCRGSLRAAVNNDNERLRLAAGRIVYGESDVETVALKGVRCSAPLPVTLRAVGCGTGRRRFSALAGTAEGTLVAIIGACEANGDANAPRATAANR
ncbi:MAG TPA: hypothetical protein VIN77_14795 [Aurantimonas sp.]|uniref:Uncharacterized protein n=1 Tax=Aurantimonas marianensis TaxID=2920428 RepID=A0A9X2H4E9_9HYPH|nr:hypothetical protein [Aurantimonas marianensis]MCP3054016.1 hypothetical protein [Aurantimonas marianensis]